jgi:3-phosphoshikimate 1-carboxyvinyltransferase
MKRIIEPLRRLGASIEAREGNLLPLTIRGGVLRAIDYSVQIASAQVKTAILLAGLHAEGVTRVHEPSQTRNHTEVALRHFGAELSASNGVIEIRGGQKLTGREVSVPGDVSSAAFFVAAALCAPQAHLRIRHVGLNPTRTGFIDLLKQMGGRISLESEVSGEGEPVGSMVVENSELSGTEIHGHWIGNVIDEIPVFAVLATQTRSGVRVRDAAELRSKETDRISAITDNLRLLGVQVEEFADGFYVPGNQRIRGGRVHSRGDHRIAMAFAVAGLLATDPVTIEDASCVSVSYPGFFDALKGL